MAEFLQGSELNLCLEQMIQNAESYILIVSPYIKLHDRIRDELRRKKGKPDLEIVVMFGKNEEEASKSFNKEDASFFRDYAKIKICYEKNLHAKFYATEKGCLFTSMNLHEYSQNNNVEIGIYASMKGSLAKIANDITSITDIGDAALNYFDDKIEHSEILFEKSPVYENTFLGLSKKYVSSEIVIDRLDEFLTGKRPNSYSKKITKSINITTPISNTTQTKKPESTIGYCIRTREEIPFDTSRPLSPGAFEVWVQYANPNFQERFCHRCGKETPTFMANPLCWRCKKDLRLERF